MPLAAGCPPPSPGSTTTRGQDRAKGILALFQERGTVDQLGLGGIRDSFADLLFPGTSTIQTRLRYFLFVPWIYQELEAQEVPSSRVAGALDLYRPGTDRALVVDLKTYPVKTSEEARRVAEPSVQKEVYREAGEIWTPTEVELVFTALVGGG